MTVVALIIAIAVHSCTISFDLWVPRIIFKTIKTIAKNPLIRIQTNCGKVRGFGCKLRIRNNTNTNNNNNNTIIETLGPMNASAIKFLSDLGQRISSYTSDEKAESFLFQRLSMSVTL